MKSNTDKEKQDKDKNNENELQPCPQCGEPGCFPGKCIRPRRPGSPK